MGFAYADKTYVAVKAAVEGEVGHLGIYAVVGSIVNSYDQQVRVLHCIGEVYAPCGVTAVVVSQLLAVEIYVCGGVGALKLQIIAVSCGQLGFSEALGVVAGAAEVVVAAVLTVNSIPAVGKGYFFPICRHGCGNFGSLLGKCPFGIEINDSSQFESLLVY